MNDEFIHENFTLEQLVVSNYWFAKVKEVISVTDPDTIKVSLDLGYSVTYTPSKGARLAGIDGPEKTSSNPNEIVQSKRLTEFIQKFCKVKISKKENLYAISKSLDMYGRPLIELLYATPHSNILSSFNKWMYTYGLVHGYDGKEKRIPWTIQQVLDLQAKLDYMQGAKSFSDYF